MSKLPSPRDPGANATPACLSREYFDEDTMYISLPILQPLIALIAGILILLVPRVLNYVVAIYLIIIGLAGLWPHLMR
jgi:hypothetical protein